MKKRRTMIISLLLVAALALGIGYAAISVSDIIYGSVEMAANENFTVDFTSVKVNNAAAQDIVSGSPVTGEWGKVAFGDSKNRVNMDLKTYEGFNAANDTLRLEFTLKNTSTESKYIAELVKDYVTLADYTITKADNTPIDEAGNYYVKATATLKDSVGNVIWQDSTHANPTTPAGDLALAPDAEATLTVEITLLRTPTEAIDIGGLDITIPFNAKS